MSSSPKIYFCGMSGPGSLENLKELIDPIAMFVDGVIWVLHDSDKESAESIYLESVKGEGKVIHYYYNRRHDVSRNQYLWCGPLKEGDFVLACDDLERINPNFAFQLRDYASSMISQSVNMLYYYGKPLFFQYHETLMYRGSPHEGLVRLDGMARPYDLTQQFPNEKDIRYNVRPIKRANQPFHWVSHYAKYMLFPRGSNHSLLGLSDRVPPDKIESEFHVRDNNRMAFIALMRDRGFSIDLNGLHQMFSGKIDDAILFFLNNEKVWQDYYRFFILKDESVVDEHKWTSMKILTLNDCNK